jgi:hypothetical protein
VTRACQEISALLLTLPLPRINELMTSAVVDAIHATVGSALTPGAALMDISVDLSAVVAHDCPPISLFRIILRDRVWLRRIAVARGDDVPVGGLLATFSTTADESPEGEPARPVRVTIAGILAQSQAWREEPR